MHKKWPQWLNNIFHFYSTLFPIGSWGNIRDIVTNVIISAKKLCRGVYKTECTIITVCPFNGPWSVLQKFSTLFSSLLDLETVLELPRKLKRRGTVPFLLYFSIHSKLELVMSMGINSRHFLCHLETGQKVLEGACWASVARPRNCFVACC